MPTEAYYNEGALRPGALRIEPNSVVFAPRFPNVLTTVLRALDLPENSLATRVVNTPGTSNAPTSSSPTTGFRVQTDRTIYQAPITSMSAPASRELREQTVTGVSYGENQSTQASPQIVERDRGRFGFIPGNAQVRSGTTDLETGIDLEAEDDGSVLFDLQNNIFVFSPFLPDEDSNKFYLAFEEESYQNRVYRNYFAITEMDIFFARGAGEVDAEYDWNIIYDDMELELLKSKYSPEEVRFALEQEVNFSFERGEGDTFNLSQEMISYESISGLGSIVGESLTISASTGSLDTEINTTNTTGRTVFAGGNLGLTTGTELDSYTPDAPEGPNTVTVVRSGY